MLPPNDPLRPILSRYQQQVRAGQTPYFDEEEFHQIIGFYLDHRQYDDALQASEVALAQYQYSAALYLRHAHSLLEHNQYAQAEASLAFAEKMEGNTVESALVRALLLHRTDDNTRAIEHLLQQLRVTPKSDCEPLYLMLSELYEVKDNYPAAFRYVSQALYLQPDNPEALERAAALMDWSDNYPRGIRLLQYLSQQTPTHAPVWLHLGSALVVTGQHEQAIAALNNALLLDPRLELAYHLLVDCQMELQQYTEAINLLAEALQHLPNNASLLVRVAECHEACGNYEALFAAAHQAVTCNPRQADAHHLVGLYFAHRNQWRSALSSFLNAVAYDQDSTPDYLLSVADALDELGEHERAMVYFRKATELTPFDDHTWVQFIGFLLDIERYDTALLTVAEALSHCDSPRLHYAHAGVLLLCGKRQQATATLLEALYQYPQHSGALAEIVPEAVEDPDFSSLLLR